MPDFSEQKVIVICDFTPEMQNVIVHGARMAGMLKKELCLLAVWKKKNQKVEIQEKLSQTTHNLKSKLPDLQISFLLLEEPLRLQMNKLVERYNAVLVVIHQSKVKSALKALKESSIPFLFVNASTPEFLQYKNVLVPVDFRKASKETSLWASYFGRFNKSHIQVIFANDTDREESVKLMNNVNFFRKFLSSLYIQYTVIAGESSSWGICRETLTNAKKWNGDVMIFSASSSISLLDLIIGLPEKKLIAAAQNLPILLINPERDICVLCD